MIQSTNLALKEEQYTRSITLDVDALDNLSLIVEFFTTRIQPLLSARPSPVPLQNKHSYTQENAKYRKRVVDDGWTVTNYNDVIWQEPGTCEGRATITRGQYEDFNRGIGELQNAIADLKKSADELPALCLKQKIEKLEKLKAEMRSDIGEKLYSLLWEALDTLASARHPISLAAHVRREVKEAIEIAREFGVTLDIAREIEKLKEIEKATEHDRLKEFRDR